MNALLDLHTPPPNNTLPTAGSQGMVVRELFEIMDELLANRDHYTFEHAIRVAEISRRIGAALGLSPQDLEIIELGCLVHDIGKVAIPDDVLLKPGRFDRKDRQIMSLHPLIGASLFSKRLQDDQLTEIILNHHERLDGSGYPNGLAGEEISLGVRIVMVADVYEALVAMRPYKRPMSRDRALAILADESEAGKMDPLVLQPLAAITEHWDPLTIKRNLTASYSKQLEEFRRKTYFKEPLSDFYNYRYLIALDDRGMLTGEYNQYTIIMVDFKRLRQFNKTHGYVKADEYLNKIGGLLDDTVKMLNEQTATATCDQIILVRKGADYLIFSLCDQQHLTLLIERIRDHLKQAEQDWGLAARLINRTYDAGYAVTTALDELFQVEGCNGAGRA